MSKKYRWLAVAAAFCAAVLIVALLPGEQNPAGGAASGASDPRRPNVVVYLVDTLRADHLGVYGYERGTSPVLDRWARESVVFERAYAPTSWTKPSMVSMFSGLDPVSHGVEDRLDVIPGDVGLLAEHLKSLGYSTFGAVTNPNVLAQWGFDRGFDVYDDLDSAGHGTRADAVTAHLEGWIDELAQRQPFLLYLHVIDPHFPYTPPAPFNSRFPRSGPFPANMSVGRYDGEVAFVDSQFGRILELLRSHGLHDDTMTVFTSDHGEELWEHGSFGHGGHLFEEVVRIPLVIRFPQGRHAGTRLNERATLSDLFPTVLGAIGEPSPTGLDGRDLTHLLQEPKPDWDDRDVLLSLLTTGPDSHLVRGVVQGAYKYTRRTRPEVEESLFDIEQDPAESANLISERADVRDRLATSLDTYLAQRSSGVHLRIVKDAAGDPDDVEVTLHTTGRFAKVSGVRLEPGDRFVLSDDGQRMTLHWRLENRHQTLTKGTRLVPDEDGVVFLVDPPNARIVVEQLQLGKSPTPAMRIGAAGEPGELPFAFHATDEALGIRDVGELLAGAESMSADSPGAYIGVITAPTENTREVPNALLERLRSLGYLGGADDD